MKNALLWSIKAGLGLTLLAAAHASQAAPACDERVDITNPDRIPFQWIVSQLQDNDDDGIDDFISSGTLVGPHLVLTCGHCVYNRNQGHKATGSFTVSPAMSRDDATGLVVSPHGNRVVSEDAHKVTNNKWVDLGYTPKTNVDYGALKIVCPFEDITTYMPLAFDYAPSFVNMSGYPTADLPAPGTAYDQWRDAGSIDSILSRQLYYDVRSTGGASGAPVWEYSAANGRRQVGVNVAHSTECNGIAPRLVWNNEGLINSWMSWTPSVQELTDYGCGLQAQPLDFDDLVSVYQLGQRPLYSARRLELTPPPLALHKSEQAPTQRVYQWIENTFYAWDEYRNAEGRRYLVMAQPEQRTLSMSEARVLLTASQGWMEQVASGEHTQIAPASAAKPLPQPAIEAPGKDNPDPSKDSEAD